MLRRPACPVHPPGRASTATTLVATDGMLDAVSLNESARNSPRLVGAAIVAVVIAAWGVGPSDVWSTIAYGLVIWTTTRIAMPAVNPAGKIGSMVGQMMEGFRYIATNRLVLTLVLLGLGPLAVGFSHQTLLPALVVDELGRNAAIMGVIMAVGGIGGIAGGFDMASRVDLRRRAVIRRGAATAWWVIAWRAGVRDGRQASCGNKGGAAGANRTARTPGAVVGRNQSPRLHTKNS